MAARNQERVRKALKRAQKRGRTLSKTEIAELYRNENAPPSMDGASPLERRIQRRTVKPG